MWVKVSQVDSVVFSQVLKCWAFPEEVLDRVVFSTTVYAARSLTVSKLVQLSVGPHGIASNVVKGSSLVKCAFGCGFVIDVGVDLIEVVVCSTSLADTYGTGMDSLVLKGLHVLLRRVQ